MYSYNWAAERVTEHLKTHPRATEILLQGLYITRNDLVKFLMEAMVEWETWKALVRHIELGLGIRRCPASTAPISTKHAFSIMKFILDEKRGANDCGVWRGIDTFAKLKTRFVWEAAPLAQTEMPDRRDFDGQIQLFAEELP